MDTAVAVEAMVVAVATVEVVRVGEATEVEV